MFIKQVFQSLRSSGEAPDQYFFDKNYLMMTKGYLANNKCKSRETSLKVLYNLKRQLRNKKALHEKYNLDDSFQILIDQTCQEIERRAES